MGFTHLPPEIKWEIAFHLSSSKDLISLAQVNHQLKELFWNRAICARINSQGRAGLTPLVRASMLGDQKKVSTLLQKWAEVDLPDSLGRTPLSWASGSGHKDVVQRLLQSGAKANKSDGFGRAALSWAAEEGHLDVVELLVEYGAKVPIGFVPNINKLDSAARESHPNLSGLRGIFSRKLTRKSTRKSYVRNNVLKHELCCIDPLSLAEKNEHGKTVDFLRSTFAHYSITTVSGSLSQVLLEQHRERQRELRYD